MRGHHDKQVGQETEEALVVALGVERDQSHRRRHVGATGSQRSSAGGSCGSKAHVLLVRCQICRLETIGIVHMQIHTRFDKPPYVRRVVLVALEHHHVDQTDIGLVVELCSINRQFIRFCVSTRLDKICKHVRIVDFGQRDVVECDTRSQESRRQRRARVQDCGTI